METPSISQQGMFQIVISNVVIGNTTQKPISDVKLNSDTQFMFRMIKFDFYWMFLFHTASETEHNPNSGLTILLHLTQ